MKRLKLDKALLLLIILISFTIIILIFKERDNMPTPSATPTSTPARPKATAVYDNHGGYNFFDQNGNPISWNEYQSYNGNLPYDFDPSTGKAYGNPNTGMDFNVPNPNPESQNHPTLDDLIKSSGSSSGTGTNQSPYVTYNGTVYDTSDPAQLQSLFTARKNTLTNYINDLVTKHDEDVRTALSGGEQKYADILNSIGLNERSINQGADANSNNINTQYSNLSPNAFQSSQGTSLQYNEGLRNEGLQQTAQNRQDTNNQYNQFVGNTQRDANNWLNTTNQYKNTQLDSLANDLANANPTVSPDLGKYNITGYAPTTPQTYNISQYSNYPNASSLATSPRANLFNTINPYNSKKKDTALNMYLNQ